MYILVTLHDAKCIRPVALYEPGEATSVRRDIQVAS